jgi:hypothetical protein
MKVIVLYLPQFHRVVENDIWWGDGFTEWSAVQKAKPLFKGHEQPHIPYERNYYDLTSKSTMQWQSTLMQKYGIDGICIYHYYFKNGRRILEKPAENLLQWTDIEMPFFFSWANESWVRSWSNISDGNPWSEVLDQQQAHDASDQGILLEQNYGGREAWEAHFRYLLPFFFDSRYICQDNKPVFMFYRPQSIGCLTEMVACWRKLALEAGLPGLYLMGANADESMRNVLDESFIQEPQAAIQSFSNLVRYQNEAHVGLYLDYDEIWKKVLHKPIFDARVSLGGFTSYDDSPRRGYNSSIIHGASPQKFQYYLTKLFKKAKCLQTNFIIINAWNEWGEGMYLEPDEKNGYGYLEAVYAAREIVETDDTMEVPKENTINEERQALQDEVSTLQAQLARYRSFWQLLHALLSLQERSFSLGAYLKAKGYHRIGIYGLGMVGKHLAFLLMQNGVIPAFAIDQSRNALTEKFPVISLEDPPLAVDLIIVTVTYDFIRIQEQVIVNYHCPIVSLKTLLDELA